MIVYITKYALTRGVFTADIKEGKNNSHLVVRKPNGDNCWTDPDDRHDTWASAEKKAIEMQAKKLNSLRKQTDKIFHMKFENPDKQ